MSLEKSEKNKKSLQRFKRKGERKKSEVIQHVALQDEVIMDLVLQRLFNHGNKQTASLVEDIFVPLNIEFTDAAFNRIWDVLVATNLMAPVIGFGKQGRLSITKEGFQLMNQFGSYANFIQLRDAAQQQQLGGKAVIIEEDTEEKTEVEKLNSSPDVE